MPTGYTCIIEDGDPTFKQYAMRCARAFGALGHMREDDLNAKIEPAKADTSYEEKRLAEVTRELAELEAMTPSEIAQHVATLNKRALAEWQEYRQKSQALMDKYINMMSEVSKWVPPTEEHKGLKAFMMDQIKASLPWMDRMAPTPVSPDDYITGEIDRAHSRVQDYRERIQELKDRTVQKNKWVEELVKSL